MIVAVFGHGHSFLRAESLKTEGPALVVTESGLVAVAFEAPLHPVQAAQVPTVGGNEAQLLVEELPNKHLTCMKPCR